MGNTSCRSAEHWRTTVTTVDYKGRLYFTLTGGYNTSVTAILHVYLSVTLIYGILTLYAVSTAINIFYSIATLNDRGIEGSTQRTQVAASNHTTTLYLIH